MIAVSVLILAIALDLLLGDPSPNSPWKSTYKLHPTVLMGKLTKALEPHFKNLNPKIAKLNGALLAIIVILAFTLPVHFGLGALYTLLCYLFYALFAIILLKLTICIKLETDYVKAATKTIEPNDHLQHTRAYPNNMGRNHCGVHSCCRLRVNCLLQKKEVDPKKE